MIAEVPYGDPEMVVERRLGTSPCADRRNPPIVVFDAGAKVLIVGGNFASSTVSGWTASDWYSIAARIGRNTTSTFEKVKPVEPVSGEFKPQDASAQIAEIRRLLGVSVDQLSRLLGCSRQAFYDWQNGLKVSLVNRERISKLLATLQHIDRGSVEDNQNLLFASGNGFSIFALLEAGEYDRVRTLTAKGPGRPDALWKKKDQTHSKFADEWYDRLIASDDIGDSAEGFVGRETGKRLRLKKL
ncbi:hypothetical protein [Rhizobium sp. NZLR1]|uniref:hypothetical protein n=1 Tax=Rhizobium sp. NZLR1 TaxID=2731096 RepID=UPI001A99D842|nr:hypothetical protein [Rhizobium sp. NZLR1]MBX5202245.1 hypothetical protein [Rhizobium sp. NZLR1]QSZ20841.1 hypothetical protein J3O30_21540 [Rhizobium sp. NZLR1]